VTRSRQQVRRRLLREMDQLGGQLQRPEPRTLPPALIYQPKTREREPIVVEGALRLTGSYDVPASGYVPLLVEKLSAAHYLGPDCRLVAVNSITKG
jgi:hypothetical protein